MNPHGTRLSRRALLQFGGLAATGGLVSLAFASGYPQVLEASAQADVRILHAALYLENEAVTAYEAGAKSGLLAGDVLAVAAAFMDDHKYHRDGIAGVLTKLGEYADAEPYLVEAHRTVSERAGPWEEELPKSIVRAFERLYVAWGRPQEANAWRSKLLQQPQ